MSIMPSERETSKTVTGTTAATVAAYGSTYMTGFVDEVYIAISKAATTAMYVKVTTSSTANVIFTVNNPSTLGAYYRPRATAVLGGTTAKNAVHGTSQAVPISMYRERMRISIPATTDIAAHVASVTVRINPLY
jgi:hypothetical protein